MSSTGFSSSQSIVQNIKYTGPESEYATELHGQVVNIQCSEGSHNHGSSKVKLTDRIDYNWEFKYYHGHLVAAHIKGKIAAYAMKGKEGGMVRVVHQENHAKRALIRNLKDDIKELAFAYSSVEVILGCVDCEGNILIYNIEDSEDSLSYTLLLHVFHKELPRPKTNFRLAWCPYVPSMEELDFPEESEKMFVILNGSKAEIYNVATLNLKYGSDGPIDPDNSYEGYTEINHTSDLVDASFSSDGCAIALACKDGFVKFFQLFMCDPEMQKCLHEWVPHEGKALTSVIFVDNILQYAPHCWKFAVTGAMENSELKLWSCETWSCLQTINFLPNPKGIIPELFFNVAVDYSGKYLVVSDINNRGVYVIELQKNEEEQLVCAKQLAHFLIPAPFMSFHILEAATKNFPFCYNNSSEDLYDDSDTEFDDEAEITVQSLKMLVIQPKKFQECNVTFQPDTLLYKGVIVTENVIDDLVDLTTDKLIEDEPVVEKMPDLDDLQTSVTLLIQQQSNNTKLTLMTPDDFTSPGKSSKSSSLRNSITNESVPPEAVEKIIDSVRPDFQRPQKENFASAGSSPSREVQEILSLTNASAAYPTQEYFSNLASLQGQNEGEPPQKDYSATSGSAMLYQDSLNWPKISLVKESNPIKQLQDGGNLNKQELETVYLRMNGMEASLKEQSILMAQLFEHMKSLNQSVVSNSASRSTQNEFADFTKEIESVILKQHLQVAKMLENVIHLQQGKHRELQESIMNAVGQVFNKTVPEMVTEIVQHEIQFAVLPAMQKLMETYWQKLESANCEKIASLGDVVDENLAKIVNSKSFEEKIARSIALQVTPHLEKSYRESIAQNLVPSWERVCAQMFQQINDTFYRGTKEYTASVEAHVERQRRTQESSKDIIVHLKSASESLKANADKLTDSMSSQLQAQLLSLFKTVQDKLVVSVKDMVSSEIQKGFNNQVAVIQEGVLNAVSRSRTVTPAPHVDTHLQTMAHIQQALAKRTFDEAFQLALSAENLNMVIFVCERVDANKVFGEKCLLSQSVLLALIQQLSMEMHKNSQIKLSYLRPAFLALSPDGASTKQFIPKVLTDLLKQLTLFMQTNPPLKEMNDARILKMAVESMLSFTDE
ncbi:hypothetical protein HUJ04_005443 [Dendroctonus ponderosae]|uniref:Enhancer of mRNA-decapping protein 4 WD40 repeat region domain-containing protein n=2 Tax=Dendroctonus ponderosae TaxID=77166 RepID=A0AAR5PU34_DENPD|nr:hypothetical protein HUJ04_005443 [Dendroctonus ponderosae]